MAMIEFDWQASHRQVRQFTSASLIALPLAAWLIAGRPLGRSWGAGDTHLVLGALGAAILLATLGWLRPKFVKPVYLAAMLVALPIGIVVSELVTLTGYVVIFTPLACFFRLTGRDALDRSCRAGAKSYWLDKPQPDSRDSYFHQS